MKRIDNSLDSNLPRTGKRSSHAHHGRREKRFIGKSAIIDDWPLLFSKIGSKNPAVKRQLEGYL